MTRGNIRIPDAAFFSNRRLATLRRPVRGYPALAPDLAVEVLSPANTRAEIDAKLIELRAAGTQLAWVADPVARTVKVHASAADFVTLGATDTLDGGAVLPGFTLIVGDWLPERPAETEGDE